MARCGIGRERLRLEARDHVTGSPDEFGRSIDWAAVDDQLWYDLSDVKLETLDDRRRYQPKAGQNGARTCDCAAIDAGADSDVSGRTGHFFAPQGRHL